MHLQARSTSRVIDFNKFSGKAQVRRATLSATALILFFCFGVFTVWENKAIAYRGICLYFLVLSFALVYPQYGKLKPLLTQAFTFSFALVYSQYGKLKPLLTQAFTIIFFVLSFALVYSQYGKLKSLLT